MKFAISVSFFIFSCFQLCYSSQRYTSIFSFGNSILDTGNYLFGSKATDPLSIVGRLPYGMTYFGRPTGRFSDGRVLVDFIATDVGLPLIPPYLAHGTSFRQGANFAVIGAMALDPSFFIDIGLGSVLLTNYSLSAQLKWFEKLRPSLCRTPNGCHEYFGKSLFLVGSIGGNDYNLPMINKKLSLEQVYAYVPKVVEAIATTTQTLIDLGAVNVMVVGNLPTGCSPLFLTLMKSPNPADYDSRIGCLKKLNDLAMQHNTLLIQALKKLRLKNPGATIIYANFYDSVVKLIQSPTKFGFTESILKNCCGSGGGPYNFNISEICGLPGSSVCSDPSVYLNWDGIHYTDAGYKYIVNDLLYGL